MPQNLELEAVKRERASLFKSLAALKTSQEKTGAKIQEDDIRVLRQELDAKMSKVNELREVHPGASASELSNRLQMTAIAHCSAA